MPEATRRSDAGEEHNGHRLSIFLSSTLRKFIPGYNPAEGLTYTPERPMTVAELCRALDIPTDKVKIVMINGRSARMEERLQGTERVGLFPAVGGG